MMLSRIFGRWRRMRICNNELSRRKLKPRLSVSSLESRDVPTATVYHVTLAGSANSKDASDPTGASGDILYCVNQANANFGTDTIDFLGGSTITTANLTTQLSVSDSLVIVGKGQASTTIKWNGAASIDSRSFKLPTT